MAGVMPACVPSWEPAVGPPPRPCCGWCGGSGVQDDDDFGECPCLGCEGSAAGDWVAPAELVLNPTHSLPKVGQRRAVYDPARGLLRVWRRKQETAYTVRELHADPGHGRGFELEKAGTAEVYHVSCGPGGVACTCGGETFRSNDKANARAAAELRRVHPSYGCVHADAIVPLVRAGWFGRVVRDGRES